MRALLFRSYRPPAYAKGIGGARITSAVGQTGGVGHAESAADGRRTPQIRDVAAVAGVSHQTVSRVLNNSPKVRPATRQLVMDAMERLQYRPNRAARALGLGRANGITVVTANTMLYGYASVLQGVEEA